MNHQITDGGIQASSKVDLLELYSGAAKPTEKAPHHGLTSLQPFDIIDGYDLKTSKVQQWVNQAIAQFRPLLLMIGYPCTNFCIFNENLNYHWRMEELHRLRSAERQPLTWVVELCLEQASRGRLYLLENPLRSRLWEEKAVKRLASHSDNIRVVADAGAFGARDVDGYMIHKPHVFYTNSALIATALNRRMCPEERAMCRALQAHHVTNSQVYPDRMVRSILQALRQEALQRDPHRFQEVHAVLYARPVDDEGRWRSILQQVQTIFGTTTTKSLNLKQGQRLYDKVAELVPWELTRVQVTITPAVRRFPTDFGYTHRGAALMYNDGTLELESEDLVSIEYPRQRFTKPVACAVFFYGIAEDEQRITVPHGQADENLHLPGLKTDIRYPGLPPGVPKEVQASVARLHINAGHPSKQEMIRLFTMHGVITTHVLSCLEHLQCGTCKRTTLPQQPRPAAIPQLTGQFGDRLQADRFWIRDLTGHNYCVLGMVDMATCYQQALRLKSANSADALEAFKTLWFRPFGYPLILEVDDDRTFAGHFKEQIEGYGTHLLVVPAEAHWRIGTVERRNAVLRNVIERMIDERGCV